MSKKYSKSNKKMSCTASKKFAAAGVAAILAGSSISMFGVAANSAYACEPSFTVTIKTPEEIEAEIGSNHPTSPEVSDESATQSSVEQTAAGLFKSAMNDSSLNAEQREDARKAYETLTGQMNKPSWYDEKVKLGAGEDNPDSIKRLKNAISYMRAINTYRQSRGLNTLGVSLEATSWAINNAFYSADLIEHSKAYKSFENLAWDQYGDGSYKGGTTPETMTSAMKQWITEEKAVYDSYEAKGQKAPYGEVGHYLNFIDNSLNSMGFTTGNISQRYGSIAAWDATFAKGAFTVDSYEKLINNYLNGNVSSSSNDQTPETTTPETTTPETTTPETTTPETTTPETTTPETTTPETTTPETVAPDVEPSVDVDVDNFNFDDLDLGNLDLDDLDLGDLDLDDLDLGDLDLDDLNLDDVDSAEENDSKPADAETTESANADTPATTNVASTSTANADSANNSNADALDQIIL